MSVTEDDHAIAAAELSVCRAAARGTTPVFPPEWGPPVSQHWLTVWGKKETVHEAEPSAPSLTVWRWETFEVTATFDIPCTSPIPGTTPGSLATAETVWKPVPPRGAGWVHVGLTTHRSTLWRRPLGRVVPFKKKGQRRG